MRARYLLVPLITSILLLAACDDDADTTTPTQTVSVRVVNAASGTAGTLSVVNGGTTLATNLGFRGVTTTCVNVPVGTQALAFRSGTTTVATANGTFTAGNRYTVVLTGTGATPTATVFTDNATTPTTGNAAIRFINATGTAGDIHATPAATTTLSSTTMLTGGGNLAAGASTTFLTSPMTNTRFRLTTVNTPTTVRSDTGTTALTFPTGGVTTVVFTDAGTPAGATFLQANPCP